MSRWLFLPNSVLKDLAVLAELDAGQFAELGRILGSDIGLRRYAASLQIAEVLAIPDEDAAGLYSLWRYVQEERSENGRTGQEVAFELLAFLEASATSPERTSLADKAARIIGPIRDRETELASLFGNYPERDKAKKIERLGLGPIPHFVEFKALCDIRPIYDEGADSIEKNVLILTLRFVTHGNYDEYNDVSMNITEEDLGGIEEELKRLRKKLKLLGKRYPDLISRKSSHKRGGK